MEGKRVEWKPVKKNKHHDISFLEEQVMRLQCIVRDQVEVNLQNEARIVELINKVDLLRFENFHVVDSHHKDATSKLNFLNRELVTINKKLDELVEAKRAPPHIQDLFGNGGR